MSRRSEPSWASEVEAEDALRVCPEEAPQPQKSCSYASAAASAEPTKPVRRRDAAEPTKPECRCDDHPDRDDVVYRNKVMVLRHLAAVKTSGSMEQEVLERIVRLGVTHPALRLPESCLSQVRALLLEGPPCPRAGNHIPIRRSLLTALMDHFGVNHNSPSSSARQPAVAAGARERNMGWGHVHFLLEDAINGRGRVERMLMKQVERMGAKDPQRALPEPHLKHLRDLLAATSSESDRARVTVPLPVLRAMLHHVEKWYPPQEAGLRRAMDGGPRLPLPTRRSGADGYPHDDDYYGLPARIRPAAPVPQQPTPAPTPTPAPAKPVANCRQSLDSICAALRTHQVTPAMLEQLAGGSPTGSERLQEWAATMKGDPEFKLTTRMLLEAALALYELSKASSS